MSSPGLSQLEQAVRRDLERTNYPGRAWVPKRHTADGVAILDTLIVGGGQSGLAVAFGLMREKVTNLLVLDLQGEKQEGPWRNFARMVTLRTPKYLTGPDLGIPSLTIRAWYEAQHGADSWEDLGLIRKDHWADYLHWYRKTLGIPVRNHAQVGALEWDTSQSCWRVPVTDLQSGATDTLYARTVVLGNGYRGFGTLAGAASRRAESSRAPLGAHPPRRLIFRHCPASGSVFSVPVPAPSTTPPSPSNKGRPASISFSVARRWCG